MSSNAPDLPSSGWRIIFEPAVARFVAEHPLHHLKRGGAVADWIVQVRIDGPPDDRMEVVEDLYISSIGPDLIAEYRVIESEYLVIVKGFLPA